jgi:hypothetical protein
MSLIAKRGNPAGSMGTPEFLMIVIPNSLRALPEKNAVSNLEFKRGSNYLYPVILDKL